MKKCFLYAYDRQNLGDDLFVHTITKRYPHVKFYMWSDVKNREVFRCLPNLKVVDQNSRFVRLLNRIRPSLLSRYRAWLENRCEAVVYIGGSLFMEYENWEQLLTWWEYEAENRAFYVLGANFGPYHTENYRKKIGEIYGKMKDICFRDRYSYDLFQEIPTVRQAPDILFSYPMPKVSVKEKQIFVSVIDCAGKDESHGLAAYDKSYVKSLAKLLKRQLKAGYSLVLGSFCTVEGDKKGIEKLLQAMDCKDDPRVEVLSYDGTNWDEMTRSIAQSQCVIATRFHGVILALAAGRPVLPLIYSDKTRHVLEDLGFKETAVDIRSHTDFSEMELPNGTACHIQSLVQESQKHFEKLDEIFK